MLDLIEMEEIKNDIKYLSLQYETAVKTLFKYNNNEITLESAQNVILSMNNYENIEEITIESGEDKTSFLSKLVAFIKKIFDAIINTVITLFKKVRNIYYRVSKQAYKIESEINKGHFEYNKVLEETLQEIFNGFNIDKTQPIEHFINYIGKMDTLFNMSGLKFNKIGDLTLTGTTYEKITNEFCKAIKPMNNKNTFLTALSKSSLYNIDGVLDSVIGFNPNTKAMHAVIIKDNKYEMKNIQISDNASILKESEIKMDLTSLGKFINIASRSDRDFDRVEKRVNDYIKYIKGEISAEISFALSNPGRDAFDKEDMENHISYTQQLVHNLNTKIFTVITSNVSFISSTVYVIERYVKVEKDI